MKEYMVNYDEVKDLPVEQREDFANNSCRILIGTGSLEGSGCLFRVTFRPGGFHAVHLHTKCDEFVYVLSGHGLKGVGDKVYKLGSGCAYYLPKGVSHWMLNTHSIEPIEVVGFYPDACHFDETGYQYIGPIPDDVIRRECRR